MIWPRLVPFVACSLIAAAAVAAGADADADTNVAPTLPKGTCTSQRAVISIVGRIAAARTGSYTAAMLTTRAAGDALISHARDQTEMMEHIRALRNDPKALQAYIEQRQQKAMQQVMANKGESTTQQMQAAQLANSTSGVQIRVDKDGSFRCDGVAQGSYDLIASVTHLPANADPASRAGYESVVYAQRIDVPVAPHGRRLIVEANSFSRQFSAGL